MKPTALTIMAGLLFGCGMPGVEEIRVADLEGAEAAFRANIQAIHDRDVDTYLSFYLNSPDFIRAGGGGLIRGYEQFAAERRSDDSWPDTLIAGEPQLTWITPGVVYGAYPYTVVQQGDTSSGWSERLFRKVGGAWRIQVTSVIQSVPDDDDDADHDDDGDHDED